MKDELLYRYPKYNWYVYFWQDNKSKMLNLYFECLNILSNHINQFYTFTSHIQMEGIALSEIFSDYSQYTMYSSLNISL